MNRLLLLILLNILPLGEAWWGYAQTATQVLDKCASVLSAKKGAEAHFQIAGQKIGNTSGTIAIKGSKFNVRTPDATVWFDGKTQWTYLKKTNEVNVSTPNQAKLAQMNPLTFIYIYKKGYDLSLRTVDGKYEVRMQAQSKQAGIQELFIVVDKKSFVPSQVRMRQKDKWTTINISGFKSKSQSDATFHFSSKDFPSAEIVDLR